MKSPHPSLPLVAFAAVFFLPVRAEESATTIKFSDPTKPGTVRISLGRGELRVQGTDTQEVAVKSDAQAPARPRKDGLRELTAASSFSFSEKDNVVTLDTANDWKRSGHSNLQLTVPRSTTIVVHNAWGGDIACNNLAGDIEINSTQGEIRLDGISGGAVVSTMSGQIHANIRELQEGKPLSFTSMNGEVVVRVPETAKASVRLRTQNGAVLTDFPDTALVTKTESSPVPRSRSMTIRGVDGKGLSLEIQESIREATQISATVVKEALEAVKEGLEEARIGTDEARREMDRARAEMDRARRNAERELRTSTDRASRTSEAMADAPPAPPAPPSAPRLAMSPPKPTITGGKLVTGTLNGGGPEISVATMNGDVTLRKLTDSR
jgi:hypothetical protein